MLKAVTRQATAVDAKVRAINAEREGMHEVSTAYYFDHYATPEDIAVMVTEADFMAADEELIPSVSAGELQHYEKVRATFEGSGDKKLKPNTNGNSAPAPAPSQGQVPILPIIAGKAGKMSAKAQGKTPAQNKGKGKAVATYHSDDESDEASDGVVNGAGVNGRSKGKGKAVMGFQDGTASDDDGLY